MKISISLSLSDHFSQIEDDNGLLNFPKFEAYLRELLQVFVIISLNNKLSCEFCFPTSDHSRDPLKTCAYVHMNNYVRRVKLHRTESKHAPVKLGICSHC